MTLIPEPEHSRPPLTGLTTSEVEARRKQGLGNNTVFSSSRSYVDIVRSNVLNAINIILFIIGAVMISIDRASDAVTSVGLILLNIVIGIYQESRAKRQLDQIALLTRPSVTLIRNGQETMGDPSVIVQDDIIKIIAGDQMVVDGIVLEAKNVEIDESLLTGESDFIQKDKGSEILSGSFCVTGTGYYQATKVGGESFANRLVANAREFQMKNTPLQNEINLILRLLMLLALFIGALTLVSTIISETPFMRQVQFATVIAGLVPNGLFLMVIIAYAMGSVRIAQRGALVQQSNAVENLSRVTVLCTDKTGTLTANDIVYDSIYSFDKPVEELEQILKVVASSQSSTNKTSNAIINALGKHEQVPADEVVFSSKRKWSAVAFDNGELQGVYALGAWEMLSTYIETIPNGVEDTLRKLSEVGNRILAFAYAPQFEALHHDGEVRLPQLTLLGFVTFTDQLRPHLKETLLSFANNGIQIKVISGDNPQTVASLAKQAGVPGDLAFVSGVDLAEMSDAEFAQAAFDYTIFGRIAPNQKESLVNALQANGKYVAMMGDGVNDVLSLKKADMGIAMESGSNATRSVADMILLDDSFAALPAAFIEGQRIVNGMKDILRLFLTRVIYSALLIVGIGFINLGFPLEPKHNDLLTILVVGIPTLALAFWARPGILPKKTMLQTIAHFVLPASLSIYAFGLLVYIFTIFLTVNMIEFRVDITPEVVEQFRTYAGITYDIAGDDEFIQEVSVLSAQTALTIFLVYSGLILIVFVEPPIDWFVGGDEYSGDWRPTILAAGLLVIFWIILYIPPFRAFFELTRLSPRTHVEILLVTLVWMVALRFIWRNNLLERFIGIELIDS